MYRLTLMVAFASLLLTSPRAALAQQEMGQRGITRVSKSPEEILKELYNKRYAVVVGINKYPTAGDQFQTLKAAVNDSRNVASKLRELKFDEVFALEDDKATKQAITSTLSKVGKKAKENDMVVFFFAGHGHTEGEGADQMGFILPYDYNPEDSYTTSIAMTELQNISKLMKAKHVLYAMDSCFSGGIFIHRAAAPTVPNEGRLQYLKNLTRNRAHIVLTAGGKNEVANESGGTGLFTQALIEGLSGKADFDQTGFVTAHELGLYIQRRIPEFGATQQNPQVGRLQGEGDVVLTMLRPLEDIQRETVPSLGSEQADALKREMERQKKELEEWQRQQARIMEEQQKKMREEEDRLKERQRQAALAEQEARRKQEEAEAAKREAESSGSKRRSYGFGGGGF